MVGCALALAYGTARPQRIEEFAIVSILNECVREQSAHTFQLPSNLPSAAVGNITGAWFWIPSERAAADEVRSSSLLYIPFKS